MRKTIISVQNLIKNYGSFPAVKGLSFDVFEGEIFGLLGPNGAGKSTTLEIIETLREKTAGKVLVDGMDLDKQPNEIKKIIGVQLQTRCATGICSFPSIHRRLRQSSIHAPPRLSAGREYGS